MLCNTPRLFLSLEGATQQTRTKLGKVMADRHCRKCGVFVPVGEEGSSCVHDWKNPIICKSCAAKEDKNAKGVIGGLVLLTLGTFIGSIVAGVILFLSSPLAATLGLIGGKIFAVCMSLLFFVFWLRARSRIKKGVSGCFSKFLLVMVKFISISTAIIFIVIAFYNDGEFLKSVWGLENKAIEVNNTSNG
jgi:hypothetical protein